MSTPTRETLAARLRAKSNAHADSVRPDDTGRIADYHRESAVLLRQAADALAAMAWQPMDTAPKDGTRFLAWFIDTHPVRDWMPDDVRHVADVAYWTDHNGGGFVSYHPGTPTHWQPLPPPPAGETAHPGADTGRTEDR